VGGMAEVFLGRMVGEGGFEKVVAIKRILQHLAQNEKFIRMFMDEARISATLSHGSICQIFELGRDGDTPFIAMEYVAGLSLRSVLRHFRKQLRQPVPPAMAAYLVGCICAALEYAHTRRDSNGQPMGIVHRDISPSNILISFGGEVKLIDFGVAKATHRMQETVGGDIKGKYAYMSPEQASGLAQDHRSDVFATGTILLELLTGRNPFRGETDLATLSRVQRAEVPLPQTTLEGDTIQLFDISIRALSKNPDDRYQSAGQMQEALEGCGRQLFGARQLAQWMQHTFPEEEQRVQEVLYRAAQEEEPTVVPQPDAPPEPTPLRAGVIALSRVRSTGKPTTPGSGIVTPVGPTPAVRIRPAEARPDPSLSPTPLTPSTSAGKVATPADPTRRATGFVTGVGRPPERRSSPWVHVVLFLAFALVVGGGVFVALTRCPSGAEHETRPVGSVRIRVQSGTGAQVFVDGTLHGALGAGEAYVIQDLLEGKHRVRLRGADQTELEQIVEVRRGQTTPLSVRLNKGN